MEIVTKPTFQHVTWVTRDFWELPQEKEFFLDSPEFLYRGDPYSIRLYPKRNGDKTAFHVRKLSGNSPEIEVSCAIGLMVRLPSGYERYLYCPVSLEENESYPRSWIEEDKDEYVPDGSLTIVCCMSLSEESTAGSSAQGEEEQGGFPGHSASFSSRRSPAKMELTTQSPCTQVQLFIPNVFQLLRGAGDSLTSPEFLFAGDTYCFRFEANGNTGDTDLRLVRLTSNFTENAVDYRYGYGDTYCITYFDKSRLLVGNVGFCVSLSTQDEESDKYLLDGDLHFVLFLRLGEQNSAEVGNTDASQKPSGLTDIEKLQSDRTRLLQEETENDVCFVVRGKEFRVHRNVLRARSKVFEAMFGDDMDEKESGREVVDDIDPDTFGDFIEYLCNGDVEAGLSDDNAFGLYVAANRYAVSTLKAKCLEHIRRSLSVESLCDVLARQYRD